MSFLDLESLVINRLKEETTIKYVMGISDMQTIESEKKQFTPAIYVIYEDYAIHDEETFDNKNVGVMQLWSVILAVKNVKDTLAGGSSREDASSLIDQILKALKGWTPDESRYFELALANPLYKASHKKGTSYFPFCFKTFFYP